MTPEQLAACGTTDEIAQAWADPLTNAMTQFGIDTPLRQASFLAQVLHESEMLRVTQENLDYSAESLLRLFHAHFDEASASEYARHPERIANHIYANRMGNGDEASGDGWKNRGHGPIQITGADNMALLTIALNLDITSNPDLLLDPVNGAASAGWFWSQRNLNDLADNGKQREIRRRVNGGEIGLDECVELYKRICGVFGIDAPIND
jgi:putative chitinase